MKTCYTRQKKKHRISVKKSHPIISETANLEREIRFAESLYLTPITQYERNFILLVHLSHNITKIIRSKTGLWNA